MMYSDDLIEEVRSRNDIVDVVSNYVRLTKKGSSYFGLCPFHNEKSPSFSVSGNKQMFYCFGCGEGGNVFSFIMKYENFSFSEAVKYLADRAGMALPEVSMTGEQRRQQERKNLLYDINKEAALYYHRLLKTENGKLAYNYLKKRELSDETIVKFGLGASGQHKDELYRYMKSRGYQDELLKDTGLFVFDERGVHDRFRNRAMFPIMNINGKVIGFGGRVMGEGEPKYLNSPETVIFDKGRNLFGMNLARSSRKNNFIICEGYMDVIALHQAGFDQAVASLGTALTAGHASLMKRYVSDVLVCYDSDNAGTKAAVRAIGILRSMGLRTTVINMKPYKDPDEFIKALGAEEFQNRIDNAKNSFLFEIEVLQKNYNLDDPTLKTAFHHEIAKKLLEFEDELERKNYIEAVSREFFIPADSLNKLVIKHAAMGGLVSKKSDDTMPVSDMSGLQPGEFAPSTAPRKKEKDDGTMASQRLLLTWLIEDTKLYKPVSQYILPDDFTDPVYHKVATMLFEQFEAGEPNPAMIISSFDDEEDHRLVAKLFNTELPENMDMKERQRAINDIVYRVKKNGLDYRSKNAKDAAEIQAVLKEQQVLRNLHINLK